MPWPGRFIFMMKMIFFFVMAGLDPAIHVFLAVARDRTWMPGTSPGMTS
jgi:hypothetical protein